MLIVSGRDVSLTVLLIFHYLLLLGSFRKVHYFLFSYEIHLPSLTSDKKHMEGILFNVFVKKSLFFQRSEGDREHFWIQSVYLTHCTPRCTNMQKNGFGHDRRVIYTF